MQLPKPDDVPLTMRQTAAMVGISYQRFRRIWPTLVEHNGFPTPFIEHRWYAPAVRAWRAAHSGLPNPSDPPAVRADADDERRKQAFKRLQAVRAMR